MKTKDKKAKSFDAVKTFRDLKEKISKDIQGMTFEQFKAYLDASQKKPHVCKEPAPNLAFKQLGLTIAVL